MHHVKYFLEEYVADGWFAARKFVAVTSKLIHCSRLVASSIGMWYRTITGIP